MAFLERLREAVHVFTAAPSPLAPLPGGEGRQALREAVGVNIDPDEDQWRRLTGDSNRDLSPVTQRRMQQMATYVWEANLLANRLVEAPLDFILGEGVALRVEDEDNQQVLDAFWRDPINRMDRTLRQKLRELSLYGEQVYPAFVNEHSGHVRLGYLDPALIETVVADPDNPAVNIGIVTVKDKKGHARRYRIIYNGDEMDLFSQRTQEIRATFTDGDAFYFSINGFTNGRRGRSDLLAQVDWLDGYEQFLFGELDRASFMRAFLWDVTLTGATPDEVKRRASEIGAPKPGSVRVHNDSEAWDAVTPDLKAQDSSENARLFRNHILGGRAIPEHWYGGGGDVNRATGDSMGEPTIKAFACRQQDAKALLEEIGAYVLRQRAIAQQLTYDATDPAWNVEAVFPEMVARDTTKYAAALQQVTAAVGLAMDRGLISKATALRVIQSVAERLGVEIDADAELKAAGKEAATKAEEDVFTEPPIEGGDTNPPKEQP